MTTRGNHPVLLSERRKQRRPGPTHPNYAIPRDQWPNVLRRIDHGESYRQIAQFPLGSRGYEARLQQPML